LKQNDTTVDGLESKGIALLYLQKEKQDKKNNTATATAALAIFNTILQHHIVAAWVLDNKAVALSQLASYFVT
jgi:hypothetical protein